MDARVKKAATLRIHGEPFCKRRKTEAERRKLGDERWKPGDKSWMTDKI